MKKTITRKFCAFVLMVTTAFVSCDKGQVGAPNQEQNGQQSHQNNTLQELLLCAAIPDSLNVPAGNKLMLQTFAEGVQIYEVKRSATDPNSFAWVNIAPLATLYLKPDLTKPVIDHFAGPSWEFTRGPEKGEKVVAARTQGVTVDQTAIQWLLLQAVDNLSSPDNKVTFIQRICTVGGLAPTTIPQASNLGQRDSIPYRATYLLYEKEE
jgi:hypothetical protein